MSKHESMVAVSITRHADSVDTPAAERNVHVGYCRSFNGRPVQTLSIGKEQALQVQQRIYMILRCERSQACGFADVTYTRQVEIYAATEGDVDVCRDIEKVVRCAMLASKPPKWSDVDHAVMHSLMEDTHGLCSDSVTGENGSTAAASGS